MTLPFSDKPEKSSVYNDLKTKTLNQITDADFDALEARMFAEGVNGLEDEYRRLVLLKLATDKLSAGGPLDVAENKNITDTTGSGNPTGVLFRPDAGQVWQLMGASTGSLNAARADLYLYDGTITVTIGQESGASTTFDPFGSPPIYVTNDVYLQYQFFTATGNCTIRASFIRVR